MPRFLVTVHTPGRQVSGNSPLLKGRWQPRPGHSRPLGGSSRSVRADVSEAEAMGHRLDEACAIAGSVARK